MISIGEWAAVVSASVAATVPLGGLVGLFYKLSTNARDAFHREVMLRLTTQDEKIADLARDTRADHDEVYAKMERMQLSILPHTAIVGEMRNDVRELRTYVIGIAGHVGFRGSAGVGADD